MTEEIKETLEILKDFANNEISDYVYDYAGYEYETINNAINKVLDHITNLQQDLDKANDIIQKDRQFYKCRMDEYVDLKKENEELKQTLHNITINGVEEENTTVLDLIKENERLKGDLDLCEKVLDELTFERNNYKSRCEKAIKFIKSTYFYGMRSGKTLWEKYLCDLINILNGGDKK